MYQKQFVYIVKFHKGREYNFAFGDFEKLRQHLVYGWDLPFNQENITVTDKSREIIYNQDGIIIKKVVLVK